MKGKTSLAAILLVLATTLVVAVKVQSAWAAVQDFQLYGSYSAGWGFSASTITSPGPTITVNLGDTVNLTITNVNTGPQHQFLLSYHNSSTPQPGDPLSPNVDPEQTIVFTFTANVSGTFTHYCVYHPNPMYGTFVVTTAVPVSVADRSFAFHDDDSCCSPDLQNQNT